MGSGILDEHGERGSGRTTAQMKAAPQNATFVWCNDHFMYARRLALAAKRPDLRVVPLSEARWPANSLRGTRAIVIDHAAELREPDRENLVRIMEGRDLIFFDPAEPKLARALREAQETIARAGAAAS